MVSLSFVQNPIEVGFSFRSEANFELLYNPLQAVFRFFTHPLSSGEFSLCYLGLTRSIRPLVDSVGLTLFCRFSCLFSFRCCLFCGGIIFTRFRENKTINLPTYLLVRACQPDFALWAMTQFNQQFTFVHLMRTPFCSITALGLQYRLLLWSALHPFCYHTGM